MALSPPNSIWCSGNLSALHKRNATSVTLHSAIPPVDIDETRLGSRGTLPMEGIIVVKDLQDFSKQDYMIPNLDNLVRQIATVQSERNHQVTILVS